jgi:hypothetical protein
MEERSNPFEIRRNDPSRPYLTEVSMEMEVVRNERPLGIDCYNEMV